jgi:RNA polymerase sigma-70 factor (ECF subfamily)
LQGFQATDTLSASGFKAGGTPVAASDDDRDLVDAANRGDPAAFEAIYLRHRDWVVRLARRFTGADDLALDVLQETFVYLLSKLPGLQLTARLTTFLYPAVKNLSLAARRKAVRLGGGEGALRDRAAAPPPGEERHPDLAAVLGGLSDEHRETLLMRFVDGMSLEEIAGALEVPLGTVKSRIHNALDRLRGNENLKKYFEA